MRTTGILIAGLCTVVASAALAQLVPLLPPVADVLKPVSGALDGIVDGGTRTVRDLADARVSRIAALVRAN
ncbi:MAG: hypothetical protein ABI898_13325, partial [Sphingomonadales bacterium]